MKNWIALIVASGILLAGNNALADESKFPTLETEYYFRKIYLAKPKHKAMAVGLNGSFGSGWNYGSGKEAAKNAIAYCRKGFAIRKNSNGKDSRCHLAVAGNKPLATDTVSLATWQIPASGIDQPLSSGVRHLIPEGKARGIVLAVHGCNGMGSLIYNSTWGGFYNSLGLDFYVPNSFADKRPLAVCGNNEDNGLHLISEVYRLRIAQTHRTIAKLRKDNPGKPIYLWGHSEGGVIVQATETQVAGIIVSGEECGVFDMPVAAPSNVPYLYVLGAMDTFVDGMKYPITEKSLSVCKKQLGSRKWSAAVVQNNGHLIWPWREAAAKAIAKFVGGTWRKTEPVSGGLSLTKDIKLELGLSKYRKRRSAFAADSMGHYAWSDDWEYQEDADLSALYQCASRKGANIFATARHECVLVGADGKVRK